MYIAQQLLSPRERVAVMRNGVDEVFGEHPVI